MFSKLVIGRFIPLILLLIAIWQGSWAFAEFIAIGPRSLLSEMANKKELPTETNWQPSYKLLNYSSQLKPNNANLQFDLGRIAWLQAEHKNTSRTEANVWLEKSSQHLEKALSLRPTWGRAWIELSTVYRQQKKILEAYKAFVKAMNLEPYEGNSQWMILWDGFALWPMLLANDKEKFLSIVNHVLKYSDARRVIDAAVANGRENVIRPLFKKNTRKHQYLIKKIAAYNSKPKNK